jgi:hypothetical protein
MDSNRIQQCEICSAALTDGYCEMRTALTEERLRLCFNCAREEFTIKRLLEEDDLRLTATQVCELECRHGEAVPIGDKRRTAPLTACSRDGSGVTQRLR